MRVLPRGQDPLLLLASEAVAEFALRAGCFGNEFVEVETVYERCRENGKPVADA